MRKSAKFWSVVSISLTCAALILDGFLARGVVLALFAVAAVALVACGVSVARANSFTVLAGSTNEETINLAALPIWAQQRIRKTETGSMVQVRTNGDSLQIAQDGTATYNGKKVLK